MLASIERIPGVVASAPARAIVRAIADRPVLLALDGSNLAERAIPVAAEIARRRDTTLLICRAVSDTTRQEMFGFLLETAVDERTATAAYVSRVAAETRSAWPGVRVETAVPSGPAAAALFSSYYAEAHPITVNSTGTRSFWSNTLGTIYVDATGATFTDAVGNSKPAGGTVLQ